MNNKIYYKDIENILGFDVNEKVKKNIDLFNLEFTELSKKERDESILNILNKLEEEIKYSGKHRLQDWEKGWSENLDLFEKSQDLTSLIPLYHGKYDIIRWKGDFVKSITPNLDYKLHICLVDSILNHYLQNGDDVFEFGCGPGYHLLRLSSYLRLNLNGCDWTKSSQNIIKCINNKFKLDIKGYNFDFFNPNFEMDVPNDSVFYTVAALEQVSENFKMFVDFILEKKPKLVINMEPIDELLDEKSLVDFLSIKYFRKRNYLKSYLPYLESLEKDGKIEILKKQKISYGSFYVEGHSLVVWRPKK